MAATTNKGAAMVSPGDYSWQESAFQDAACITAIAGKTRDQVLAAFDAGPGIRMTPYDVYVSEGDGFVSVVDVRGGVAAIEFNGYRGSLPEVVSALSENSVAASMFWNVDDDNAFTCARDGEIVARVTMYDAAWGKEVDLPTELVALFALAADWETADLHAIGLAMVEQFVGIRLAAEDVQGLELFHPLAPLY